MNFFGVGLPEMMVIFAVALLVFGPRKLPEIGRNLAKALRTLQDASRDFEEQLNREAQTIESAASEALVNFDTPVAGSLADQPETSSEEAVAADPLEVDPETIPGVALQDPEPVERDLVQNSSDRLVAADMSEKQPDAA